MKIHNLKCWPEYFEAVWFERKTFEIRINDRDFKVGDMLKLEEYNREGGFCTGNCVYAEVVYLLESAPGLQSEYVLIGIRLVCKRFKRPK